MVIITQLHSFDYLLNAVGIRYELVTVPDDIIEEYGMIGGPLHQMDKGEADSMLLNLTPTPQRLQLFNPTEQIAQMSERVVALTTNGAVPDTWQVATSFVEIYTPGVWMAIFGLLVAQQIFVRLNYAVRSKRTFPRRRRPSFSLAIVMGWSAFFIALFIGLFRAGLLTQLLLSSYRTVFNDYEGFIKAVATGRVKIILMKGVNFLDKISLSKPGSRLHLLKEAMELNPPVYLSSLTTEQVISYLEASTHVLLISNQDADQYQRKYCTAYKLNIIELGELTNGFLFNRNVSQEIIKRLNKAINDHTHMITAFTERYSRLLSRKQVNCENSIHRPEPINILKFIGIFLLLFAGAACAFVVVVFERFFKRDVI